MDRAEHVVHRWIAIAFFVGLFIALIASGGIAFERVCRGLPMVGVFVGALETVVGIAAVVATGRPLRTAFVDASPRCLTSSRSRRMKTLAILIPQVAGVLAGVCVVHVLLRIGIFAVPRWLSERPAQFINDGVSAAVLLVVVWACALGLDPYLLGLALLGLTYYGATAPAWHLDQAPGGFRVTIQQLVVAESVAVALALGLFCALFSQSGRPSMNSER